MAFSKKIRLFTEQHINPNANVNLVKRDINYLKNVLRCRDGDIIRIFNGKDGEWDSQVRELAKNPHLKPLKVCISQKDQIINDVWLIFSLIKSSRSKLIIEKATELGISKIIAVMSLRSNVKSINLDRARLTAIESAEQCGRISVPQIDYYRSFEELFKKWPHDRTFIWGDKSSELSDGSFFLNAGGLFVGPEGGYAPEEIEMLSKHSNSKSISLGNLTLRSETAAIVMLSRWNSINKVW